MFIKTIDDLNYINTDYVVGFMIYASDLYDWVIKAKMNDGEETLIEWMFLEKCDAEGYRLDLVTKINKENKWQK